MKRKTYRKLTRKNRWHKKIFLCRLYLIIDDGSVQLQWQIRIRQIVGKIKIIVRFLAVRLWWEVFHNGNHTMIHWNFALSKKSIENCLFYSLIFCCLFLHIDLVTMNMDIFASLEEYEWLATSLISQPVGE